MGIVADAACFQRTGLTVDIYFKDGTLVVNFCNSRRHGFTIFNRTRYQQLLRQLSTSILLTSIITLTSYRLRPTHLTRTEKAKRKPTHRPLQRSRRTETPRLEGTTRPTTPITISRSRWPGTQASSSPPSMAGPLASPSRPPSPPSFSAIVSATVRTRIRGWENVWRGALRGESGLAMAAGCTRSVAERCGQAARA